MQYKYISDLHLYDVYSTDWRSSFKSLDHYASSLIDSWNTTTKDDDIVIIVGDIGHYCPRTVEVYKRLKGQKVLVVGNHDLSWGEKLFTSKIFTGVYDQLAADDMFIKHVPDDDITQKYPIFIHGHHHRYDMPNMLHSLQQYASDTNRFNCAADINNNRPCTLQELMLNKELLLEKYRAMNLL